jgi:TPR repeat protein
LGEAYSYLAKMQEAGEGGLEKNPKLAFDWYLRAADYGDTKAQQWIYSVYQEGRDWMARDPIKAMEWLKIVADRAPRYKYQLAQMYELGENGVKKKPRKAAQLYQFLAAKVPSQRAAALHRLGVLYMQGVGVREELGQEEGEERGVPQEECIRLGLRTLFSAVNKGSREAIMYLAKHFEAGGERLDSRASRGKEEDNQLAFVWFKKAAERGFAEAQFHLGRFYEEEWYEKAAMQRCPEAVRKCAVRNYLVI